MAIAEPEHWTEALSDDELAWHLGNTAVHPNVAADLVKQRRSNGAQWRIAQELGPSPAHVPMCVIPAGGGWVECICE